MNVGGVKGGWSKEKEGKEEMEKKEGWLEKKREKK